MGTLTALIEALQTGGPYAVAGIFVLVWWMERKERQAKETRLGAVYEKIIVLVQESTAASDRMQAALTSLKDAIHAMSGRLR